MFAGAFPGALDLHGVAVGLAYIAVRLAVAAAHRVPVFRTFTLERRSVILAFFASLNANFPHVCFAGAVSVTVGGNSGAIGLA